MYARVRFIMKVAITTMKPDLNQDVDIRVGRGSFIPDFPDEVSQRK